MAGRADHRRPHHGPAGRAVRRPGAAPDRGRPQRPRPGRDPSARPGPRHPPRPPAAGLDDDRRGVVRRHPGHPARPPRPPALHLHQRSGRDLPAPAADGAGHRQVRQRRSHLDPRRLDELPARRGRQGAARDHLRRLPRAPPRRARAGRPPGRDDRPSARSRPRPDPRDVADQPRHPGLPARPRVEPAVLRPLPDHVVRRDRARWLARRRRHAVRGRLLPDRPVHRPRP